jgi:tRNA(Ile)-lysidine synthase
MAARTPAPGTNGPFGGAVSDSMDDQLITTVRRTIARHDMLSRGDKVVVAVSGGPDSVCLLSILRDLSRDMELSLHAAHLDHMFRGPGSAADARFVKQLAREWNLPASIEQRDVPAYCAGRGCSPQVGAREVRYRFLEEIARQVGADRIALGHTASDQAETLIMRLLRGSGLSGLSGIPPKREKIVRPLLAVPREKILAYLTSRGISFVTDPSNLSPIYMRNRVRQEVLPLLERFNPRIVETLAMEASILREEDEQLEACREMQASGTMFSGEDSVRIDRDRFLGLSTAFRRRVLRRAWELASNGRELSFLQTEEAVRFLQEAQAGRSMALPGGMVIVREYGIFVLRPSAEPFSFDRPLAVPGTTALPQLAMEVIAEARNSDNSSEETGNYLWQAEFDYAKIALPLHLRSRRPGDLLCPAGMGGRSKKIQDLFVDEKVPRPQRDRTILLSTDQDILWVVGMRTDERFLPGPETTQVLTVTVRSTDGKQR